MLLIPLIFHPPAPASLNGRNQPVKLGLVPPSGAVSVSKRTGGGDGTNAAASSRSTDRPGLQALGTPGPTSREERMTQWK